MRALVAGIVAGLVWLAAAVYGTAIAGTDRLVYETEGNGPRIVVRHGATCLAAEDSANKLVVVEYESTRIVYRCVTP